MNANELADSIDKYLDSILDDAIHPIEDVLNESITMLRQQQAEIEALKAQILIWENAEVPVEVMADIIEELEKRGFIEKIEKTQEKCPPTSWWEGDPTCGGLTENYGLGKAQEK